MKTKILIFLLCLNLNGFGNLPIAGLCLQDVLQYFNCIECVPIYCLDDCFTRANPAYFDPAYAVAGGNYLDDFRNYGPQCAYASITTTSATSITSTTATTGGNITSDGGCSVTERGVAYNLTGSPTISGNHTSDGSGTGSFTSYLTGLSPSTLYYIRAYATNSHGTAYSNETLSFTTSSGCSKPTGLTDCLFYSTVNGVGISSEALAVYYSNNFSCSSTCSDVHGYTLGGEGDSVYMTTSSSSCTVVANGYYVLTLASSPTTPIGAVSITNGILHYIPQ